MSKAKWFAQNEGKQLLRIIERGSTIDDYESLKENLFKQAREHNITWTEDDDGIKFSNNQFFMKPKQKKESIVTIKCRSNDIIITPVDGHHAPSYADKKSFTVEGDNLVLDIPNRRVVYKPI